MSRPRPARWTIRLLVALVLGAVAIPSGAQTDEAILRARLAADPQDLGTRCELGFALVRASQYEEARALLAPTLDALPEPTASERARRGACLYNLGRAEEGLGHVEAAATRYRASLALRPNPSVRDRLAGLATPAPVPAAPPERRLVLAPDVATRCGIAAGARPDVASEAAAPGGRRAVLLDGPEMGAYRVALVGDTDCVLSAEPVYVHPRAWPADDELTVAFAVEGTDAEPRYVLRARVVHAEHAGSHWGRSWTSEEAVVAWEADGAIHAFAMPLASTLTRTGVAGTTSFALTLSFDARGRAVIADAHGDAPPELAPMIGVHTLPMRDVPALWSGELVAPALVRALRGRVLAQSRIVERVDDPALSAVLVFTVDVGDVAERGLYVPVLRTAESWTAARPIGQYDPPANDSYLGDDTFEATLSVRPVLPGDGAALVVEHTHARSAFELGAYEDGESYTVHATSVMWVDGTRVRGWTVPTEAEVYDLRGRRVTTRMTIAFDAGQATITRTGGTTLPGLARALGTHPVTSLTAWYTYRGGDEDEVRVGP